MAIEVLESRQLLAVLTVDTTSDADARDAVLSLREAIQVSNGTLAVSALSGQEQAQVSGALASPNTIAFNIPGTGVQTISVNTALPTVTSPVIIDGYSQPGSRPNTLATGIDAVLTVEVSGVPDYPTFNGLTISADDCTLQGLVVNRFDAQVQVLGSRNIIRGNFLGTDPKGLANKLDPNSGASSFGMTVRGTSNVIGGTTPAARNLISANQDGDLGVTGSGNLVQGNFIGPDITGTQKPRRTRLITGTALGVGGGNNTIGGTAPGAGNVISSETYLVSVSGTGHRVEGNIIGFDPTGTTMVGLSRTGVILSEGAINNTIGGTAPGAGNLIGAGGDLYTQAGILIEMGTTGNAVQGNTIRDSAAGIWIRDGANGNTIGGSEPGAGNIIFDNGKGGVVLSAGYDQFEQPTTTGVDPTGNTIRGNSIYGNTVSFPVPLSTAVGIDLFGGTQDVHRRTENTPGGPHTGPNLLQNYPVLQSANSAGGVTTIAGTLNSTPNASFTIDFYRLPAGSGQVPVYVGLLSGVTTDSAGNASFSFPAAGAFGGQTVYATATDSAGNTSEYSLEIPVTGANLMATSTSLSSSSNPSISGHPISFTAIVTGTPTGTVTFSVDGVPQDPIALAVVNGSSQATLTVAALTPGNHTITAVYGGDSFFMGSTATPLTQTVVTQISLGPLPATTPVGSPITATATVTQGSGPGAPPLPGVVVTFTVVAGPDTGQSGTAMTAADGTASFTFTASSSPGLDTIRATFVDAQGFTQVANMVSTQLQATPVLSWTKPADIVYGTPLSAAQLNATANVPGTFTYTPSAGVVLHAGAGQALLATFTPNDTTKYTTATITTTIDVLKATPVPSWGRPAAITYGTPLGATQLNAAANVPGTFTYTPPAGTVLNAGAAQVLSATFVPTNSADYNVVPATTTIDVRPVPLTITAGGKTMPYGAALPALTASYTGFVNGDTPASLDTATILATVATHASDVATYAITVSGAADPDYTITFAPGVLTVTPAPLTITAEDAGKVYGQANPAFSAIFSGFVLGQGPGDLGGALDFTTPATASSHVGQYLVTPGGLTAGNYTFTYTPGTLTVTPAPLTIRADDKSKLFGAPLPPLTASFVGLVNGDTPAGLDTPPVLSTIATASSSAGNYPITVGGADDPDYTINYVAGTLAITPVGPTRAPGDYNGDGLTDLALFYRQPGTSQALWFVSNVTPGGGVPFGSSIEDVPIQGDFDGDGRADIAMYRPSTAQWFIAGRPAVQFGQPKVDIPVPGDYDGVGHTELAVYRPTTGQWFIGGHAQPISFGGPNLDVPVPGDYDGTGHDQVAVYRPSTGQWFVGGHAQPVSFGGPQDVPIPGDYEGVGKAQFAVFRPATMQWFVAGSVTLSGVSFGGPGDVPVPGRYRNGGDGRLQFAVYRPSAGQWFVAGDAQPIAYGGPHMVPPMAPHFYRSVGGSLSVRQATQAPAAPTPAGIRIASVTGETSSTRSTIAAATAPQSTRSPAQRVLGQPAGPLNLGGLARTRAGRRSILVAPDRHRANS